jgi:hypothetical protein
MSDISVTQSAVLAANSNTLKATGTAGEAINVGQSVYADSSNGKIKKAQATNANTAYLVGVALSNAQGDGQPIVYATEGDVTFNSALTTGQTYVVSAAAAGGIAPISDLASTNYVGVLGVATSATNLTLKPIPTAAQKP